LLLWLHGARERGDDNLEQLRWMELVLAALPPDENDYFVLAVQCPPDETSWFHQRGFPLCDCAEDGGTETITVAMAILDQVLAEQPVDEDRIYVSGVSSGGDACWEIAMRYPERFAAAVPMAAGGGDLARVDLLTQLPIWAFHAREDDLSPEGVQELVAALKAAGGRAELTLVDNAVHSPPGVLHNHDCWTGAIKHFEAMNWLFGQRRGAVFALPPGISPWPWWNYAALALIGSMFVVVWKMERRRRRAAARITQHVDQSLPGEFAGDLEASHVRT
jgi:predicted peptidase